MASSNGWTSLFESFTLPTQPSPLTSAVDEEDSFVILRTERHTNKIYEINKDNINCDDEKERNDTTNEDKAMMEQDIPDANSVSVTDPTSEKILQLIEENTFLKERIQQNNNVMNAQYEKMLVLQEYQNQAQEGKVLVEMLKKKNNDLTDEVKELKNERNAQGAQIDALKQALIELNQSNEDDVKNLEVYKTRIVELEKENVSLNNQLEGWRIRNESENKEINALKQTLSKMTENHDGNLKILVSTTKALEELKMELTEVKLANEEKQKSQHKEIETLRTQLLAISGKPTTEEVARINAELNTTKASLMQLEQSKAIADCQIKDLDEEVLDLRAKLQGSQQRTDELFALKTQLDVFRTDFEAETKAKDRVEIENEKLLEEVQSLRMCCQQLYEKRTTLQTATHVPAAGPSSSPFEEAMMCPICNFGFTSERALENHVHRCLGSSRGSL